MALSSLAICRGCEEEGSAEKLGEEDDLRKVSRERDLAAPAILKVRLTSGRDFPSRRAPLTDTISSPRQQLLFSAGEHGSSNRWIMTMARRLGDFSDSCLWTRATLRPRRSLKSRGTETWTSVWEEDSREKRGGRIGPQERHFSFLSVTEGISEAVDLVLVSMLLASEIIRGWSRRARGWTKLDRSSEETQEIGWQRGRGQRFRLAVCWLLLLLGSREIGKTALFVEKIDEREDGLVTMRSRRQLLSPPRSGSESEMLIEEREKLLCAARVEQTESLSVGRAVDGNDVRSARAGTVIQGKDLKDQDLVGLGRWRELAEVGRLVFVELAPGVEPSDLLREQLMEHLSNLSVRSLLEEIPWGAVATIVPGGVGQI
jgi:hypothetical protein